MRRALQALKYAEANKWDEPAKTFSGTVKMKQPLLRIEQAPGPRLKAQIRLEEF